MKDTAIEIGLDLGEAVLDASLSDDIFRDIPIFRTVFNLAKIARSVSDRIFAAKIRKFIFHLPTITAEEHSKVIQNLDSDSKHRIGEIIVLSLNKIDDLEKARYIASVFAFYAAGKCQLRSFRAFMHAITDSFILDLDDFVSSVKALPAPHHRIPLHLSSLVSVGLAFISGVNKDSAQLPQATELGFEFVEAVKWYENKCS